MSIELLSAFTIGFLGSLHCVGMCGPIALALPKGFSSRTSLVVSRLLYNLGRIITYGILGIIAGMLSKTLAVAGVQQTASIVIGILMLLFVILPSKAVRRLFPIDAPVGFLTKVKQFWGGLFKNRGLLSLFVIGLLNGFLPCGFVYVAMAAASTTGTIENAIVYMMLFGVGTTPIMLATSLFGNLMSFRVRQTVNKLLPLGVVVLAVLLILRGMSLGIPYVSPKILHDQPAAEQQTGCCH